MIHRDPEDIPTPAELEPDPMLPRHLGEDPWQPWTCPSCGTDHKDGMPERCTDCGWRNFG